VADLAGRSSVMIAAPPAACAAPLLEPEDWPRWYDTLDEVRVLARDDQARPERVALVIELPMASVAFTLAQAYDLPHSVSGRQVDGNGRVVDVAAEWTFEPLDGGHGTRATYAFEATAGGRLMRAALRASRALVERDLIHGFPRALRARVTEE